MRYVQSLWRYDDMRGGAARRMLRYFGAMRGARLLLCALMRVMSALRYATRQCARACYYDATLCRLLYLMPCHAREARLLPA